MSMFWDPQRLLKRVRAFRTVDIQLFKDGISVSSTSDMLTEKINAFVEAKVDLALKQY